MNELTPAVQAATLEQLARQINQEHDQFEAALKAGLEHARKAGEWLLQAKQQAGHGNWLPWLKTHCTVKPRMAQRYMLVAQRWDELAKYDTVSHLTFQQALHLLTQPPEEEEAKSASVADLGSDQDAGPDTILLPDLLPGLEYFAYNADDSALVELVPHPDHPGYWIVGIYLDLDTDTPAVEYVGRGIRLDNRDVLARMLRRWDFRPATDWQTLPANGEKPWYVDAPGKPDRPVKLQALSQPA